MQKDVKNAINKEQNRKRGDKCERRSKRVKQAKKAQNK